MHSSESGDGPALERAIEAEGVSGAVEGRGRLAVFTPSPPATLDGKMRRRLVALARLHGFTNLAVELPQPDANLSRH